MARAGQQQPETIVNDDDFDLGMPPILPAPAPLPPIEPPILDPWGWGDDWLF